MISGPAVRVDHDQQIPNVTETQRNEAFLSDGVGIFTGQGEIVLEDRDRLNETDPVSA